MEANESTTVSGDLTSTIEGVLTNNGHEKEKNHSDSVSVGDSTPSSSSDANMQTPIVKTIQDDPISSTSDSLTHEMGLGEFTPDINFIVGVETSGSVNELVADTDFFTSELNIESMCTEKISEDVEDIANDLENLLGETTHSYGVICTNSDTIIRSSEDLKIISTSSCEISRNLFLGHQTSDCSDDLTLQLKVDELGAQCDKHEPSNKEVDFCHNLDILELTQKTDSLLEHNLIGDSNSVTELLPSEDNKDVQHIVDDATMQDITPIKDHDVALDDIEIPVTNTNLESMESIDKPLEETCHQTSSNRRDLENAINKEETCIALPDVSSNQHEEEIDTKNNQEVTAVQHLEETTTSLLNELNASEQNLTEIFSGTEEGVSGNVLVVENSQNEVMQNISADVIDLQSVENVKQDIEFPPPQLLQFQANIDETVDDKIEKALPEASEDIKLSSPHSEIIDKTEVVSHEEMVNQSPIVCVQTCNTHEDTSETGNDNVKCVPEDGKASDLLPDLPQIESETLKTELSEDLVANEVGELKGQCLKEEPNFGKEEVIEQNPDGCEISSDLIQEDGNKEDNRSEDNLEYTPEESNASNNLNVLQSTDDSDSRISNSVVDESSIENITDNQQCTIENITEIGNEISGETSNSENDQIDSSHTENTELVGETDKFCGNQDNLQVIPMENADSSTCVSNKDSDQIDPDSKAVSDQQISTNTSYFKLSTECEFDHQKTHKSENLDSLKNVTIQNEIGDSEPSNIQTVLMKVQEEADNFKKCESNSNSMSDDIGNSEISVEDVTKPSVSPLLNNEEINEVKENVGVCVDMKDVTSDSITVIEQLSTLDILEDEHTGTTNTDVENNSEAKSSPTGEIIDETEINRQVEEKISNVMPALEILNQNVEQTATIPDEKDVSDEHRDSIAENFENSSLPEQRDCAKDETEDIQKDFEQQRIDTFEDTDNLPFGEECSSFTTTQDTNQLETQSELAAVSEDIVSQEILDDTSRVDPVREDIHKELCENLEEFCSKVKHEENINLDVVEQSHINEYEIQEEKVEDNESTEINFEEPFLTMSENKQIVAETIKDSNTENLIEFQRSEVQTFEIFDENQCDLKSPKQNSIQFQPEDDGNSLDNNISELHKETTSVPEYPQSPDLSTETSALECAISHIVETTETPDISEASELQSAISQIINSEEPSQSSDLSHLHDTIPQIVESSEDFQDHEAFELQNAISQIVYPSDTTDDPKASELENAISQIIDVSEAVDSSTAELQNTITQIINSPALEEDSKVEDVLHTQIVSCEIVGNDDFEREADKISADEGVNKEHSLKNDTLMFDKINEESECREAEAVFEKEVKLEETGKKSHDQMQSIYSQPVVDLILEDMDDQLKNVIFETKSDDSIPNIPNIGDVDLDTPKTFESPHMDLMLPEESSLLNTDDIISEIAPIDQTVVGFAQEADVKLESDVISESELKINDLHENDSKDLNDVIAREIESLLELQTQDLPDDAPSIIVNNAEDNEAVKMDQENVTSTEGKLNEASMYQPAHSENDKIDTTSINDNLYQQTTNAIEEHDVLIVKDNDLETDATYSYREVGPIVMEKSSIDEVSSSYVSDPPEVTNRETDFLVSSESAEQLLPKEIGSPLVIEVGTSIGTIEEKHPHPHTEIVEISTSNYSSKMSENEDLKMTITKHKVELTGKVSESPVINETHSILKIYDPKDVGDCKKVQKTKEGTVPKLIIKPVIRSQPSPTPPLKLVDEVVEQTIPKLLIRNMSPNRPGSPKVVKSQKSELTSPLKLTIKPVLKLDECQPKSSPKLTIKPIVKTEEESSTSSPKITIKPIIKPSEEELCHSPKITIKPIIKPDECHSELVHSPRITIKPIPKPDDIKEFCTSEVQSPRITIKPVIKPEERNSPEHELILKKSDLDGSDRSHSPRITIKPIVKPEDHKGNKQDQKAKQEEICKRDKKEGSPKITIKPIVKPIESVSDSVELIDFEEQIKQERIVLKINKNSMAKDSRKRDSTEEIEKLAKIKLKFSKEGGRAHIISEQSKLKRALEESMGCDQKRAKFGSDDLTIIPIDADERKIEKIVDVIKDDVNITPINPIIRPVFDDPLEKIPVFEITPESAVMMKSAVATTVQQVSAPTPRKRGRPRKVPLVVREEFNDVKEEVPPPPPEQPPPVAEETGRPKRSCRGPSVRTTLGIRTRKPRGSGRGRGRGRVARGVGSRGGRQQRVSAAKLKLLKEEAAAAIAEQSQNPEPVDGGDVEMKEGPPVVEDVTTETSEIVLIEEETRMSADINTSRAQTPAKQVDNSVPTPGDVEDTQSSVQSTATTESTKARKGTRLEVHQEPEGEVISADQLTEYYWGGGGPYMLQEQVAQFLGIKSFKRKYPGIQRRMVDMQERDFIRESGLASEAMCDLGLTAVHSADILDIMYSDFQNKYEEYCKHQRDRQAKDFSNKQKALSLAASQEKNKHDIMQQAVQSAASWNANFNKSRKDERKACMDLQTFTVHYPKGRFKTGERNKTGHYPVALVPGQYTDYYKAFTPTELSTLPLNTMLDKPLIIPTEDDSPSDGSGSDSDSSSSDSDSSSSDSSDEDCNICSPTSSSQTKKVLAN